jgi:hypothetical protein
LRIRVSPVAFLLAVGLSACGSGGSTQPAPVSTVAVSLGSTSVGAGLTTTATAVLRDASGNVLTDRTVVWSSSNTLVATVTNAGVVSTLVPGTVTISAQSEGKTGGATLTVTGNPVATVTVVLANPDLTQGATTQAVATLRDGSGNVLSGRAVTWSSAATSVASVSASGAVTAVGPGAVLITATSEGKSGSAALTVTGVAVASVTVSLATPRVGVGQISQGAAVLRDAGGNVLSGRAVSWTSSSSAVATVSPTGLVTAVGLGTSSLTATSEGFSGSATITVTAMYAVTALSQTAPPSTAVIQPPAVKVTDASGNPRSGVPVSFAITVGGGTVTGSPAVTDATGVARLASWTFGPAGDQAVTASSTAVPGVTVEFAGLSRPASVGYDVTLRILSPMSDSQLRAFVDAKERIQEMVVGEVSDQRVDLSASTMASCGGVAVNETVDDLIIFAEVIPIDGVGNVLGQAGPCFVRGGTLFPLVGHMEFDSADLGALETRGLLEAVILHEMMHVLGFGTLWPQSGYLVGSDTTTPSFSGPGARSAFSTYNGGTTYPGSPVPVEGSSGSSGTDLAHWREADFDDELMTGYLDASVPNPLSATTVASLADLGYRVYDLGRADPYRWGTATVALRREGALQAVEPPLHMVDDVRKAPPIFIGPDGRPLFP